MSAGDHLSPEQFKSTYKPTEYGATWDDVVHHARHGNCCGIREHDAWGRGLNEQMRASVKAEGIHEPVQVKDGWVVNGHHRVAAALSTGARIPIEHTDHEYYAGQIDAAKNGQQKA